MKKRRLVNFFFSFMTTAHRSEENTVFCTERDFHMESKASISAEMRMMNVNLVQKKKNNLRSRCLFFAFIRRF